MSCEKLRDLAINQEGVDLSVSKLGEELVEFIDEECELVAGFITDDEVLEVNLFKYEDVYVVYDTDSHSFSYVFYKNKNKAIREFENVINNYLEDFNKDEAVEERLEEVVGEVKKYLNGEDVPYHLRGIEV